MKKFALKWGVLIAPLCALMFALLVGHKMGSDFAHLEKEYKELNDDSTELRTQLNQCLMVVDAQDDAQSMRCPPPPKPPEFWGNPKQYRQMLREIHYCDDGTPDVELIGNGDSNEGPSCDMRPEGYNP